MACGCELGESPVWSGSANKLYWVSSVGRELWEWDLVGEAKKIDLPEVIGCVALRQASDWSGAFCGCICCVLVFIVFNLTCVMF